MKNQTQTKGPKYRVFHVIEASQEGKSNRWCELGVAFEHPDGKGLNLVIDVMPIAFDGKLVLREATNA